MIINSILLRHKLLVCFIAASASVEAQELSMDELLALPLEELMKIEVQVGSRTGNKTLGSHQLPVDVITADELRRSGYAEFPKALNHLLSSFTYNFATIDDLTDHIRPFSLNGLKADQTLVLINGKRLHQSANLYVDDSQNSGGTGADLNLIPIEAVERVEVLRDDASAIYGSDAIAGVINIVLKKRAVNETIFSAGQRKAGDGEMFSGSYNHGDENSFVSLEYKNKTHSNTAGLDQRDYYFDPLLNGDYKITHRYGDPDAQTLSFMFNGDSEFDQKDFYYQGRLLYKESEATGYFRRPLDNRTVRAIYPDGFLPAIAPEQHDILATIGYRNDWAGFAYDVSNTLGYNRIGIRVENSLNASLGVDSPTSFDAGTLNFLQNTLNLDATQAFDWLASKPLQLAVGAELRHEEFRIEAGETASWIDGLVPVLDGPDVGADTSGGSQVFPGFSPDNANHLTRDVAALYAEASQQLHEKIEMKLALRDEHYSDFGNTLNGKASLNIAAAEALNIRSSLATGYRAPSLHQMGFYKTFTGFYTLPDNSIAAEELGIFPVDHAVARLLGAQDLEPEQSQRSNIGLTWQPSTSFQLDLDYFQIKIQDRIILSGSIDNGPDIPVAAQAYMTANEITGAFYFFNGVDTTTRGYDVSLRYNMRVQQRPLNVRAQYHHNATAIDAVHIPAQVSNLADQIFSRTEAERLMHYLPEDKALMSVSYELDSWTVFAKANYFGKVIYVNDSSDPAQDQGFAAHVTYDLDLAYQLSDAMTFAVGGHNIFDTYPDARQTITEEGFQYRGTGPFDYTGAFYYARAKLAF